MFLMKLFGINYLIDFCYGIYVDLSKYKTITKQYLNRISDSLCKFAATNVPKSLEELPPVLNDELKTEDVDLGWSKNTDESWSKEKVRFTEKKVSPNFTCKILRTDDFTGRYQSSDVLIGKFLRSRIVFSFDDSLEYIEDDKDALEIATDLRLIEGAALPTTYNTDFTMDTDESFSRIFFYGIAAPLIAKQETLEEGEDGPFVVDLPIQNYKTRSLYKPYGARIHFNSAQMVTCIYDYVTETLYRPTDDGWEAAKMHAKVTIFTLLTIREHLVWTHLIVSNDATREAVINLPPVHPIRRLLSIFTFNSNGVNNQAFDALVPRTSMLHRANALLYSEMVKVFDYSYKTSIIYKPFPECEINPALQKLADDGKFPYVTEGKEYYEIVRTFVREWLKESDKQASDKFATDFYNAMRNASSGQKYVLPPMTEPDAMVNLLSTIIFTVTAFHEIVGHVVDYIVLPSRAGFRVAAPGRGIPKRIDIQAYLYACLIGATTSKKMPKLMGEFPNYIGAGGADDWERRVWNNFLIALEAQSNLVEEREASRSFEFKFFDPRNLECSVSV